MDSAELRALQQPLKEAYRDSGDMLLQALVACAGVTLRAVATSLGIDMAGGIVAAEGDLDFRGTLAVIQLHECRVHVAGAA